jgi:hypothetical protein
LSTALRYNDVISGGTIDCLEQLDIEYCFSSRFTIFTSISDIAFSIIHNACNCDSRFIVSPVETSDTSSQNSSADISVHLLRLPVASLGRRSRLKEVKSKLFARIGHVAILIGIEGFNGESSFFEDVILLDSNLLDLLGGVMVSRGRSSGFRSDKLFVLCLAYCLVGSSVVSLINIACVRVSSDKGIQTSLKSCNLSISIGNLVLHRYSEMVTSTIDVGVKSFDVILLSSF